MMSSSSSLLLFKGNNVMLDGSKISRWSDDGDLVPPHRACPGTAAAGNLLCGMCRKVLSAVLMHCHMV